MSVPDQHPGGKVRVGFFSFTEITDPSAHRAYNEWHQLDHLPEQLPIPGIAAGERWVRTPACRAATAVAAGPLAHVHYLTLYLMTEPVERTIVQFFDLARRLHREDRFFEPRRSHLSGPFDVISATAASRVRVSAEAVCFRPNTGVHVTVEELAVGDETHWLSPRPGPEALCGLDGVAGAWSFATSSVPADQATPGQRRITVCFLDGDVVETSARIDAAGASFDRGGVSYTGPFEAITPWRWDWFDDADPG